MVPMVILPPMNVSHAHTSLILENAYLHVPMKLMLTQQQVKLFVLIVQPLMILAMIGIHLNSQPLSLMMDNLYNIKFIYLKVYTVVLQKLI